MSTLAGDSGQLPGGGERALSEDGVDRAGVGAGVRLLRAGWLIDGQGGPARKDICIAFAGGRIQSVAGYDPRLHSGRNLIDYSNATVLPALVDAHLHLALDGSSAGAGERAPAAAEADSPFRTENDQGGEGERQIGKRLIRLRLCGVGAVRDGGDRHGLVLRHARALGSAGDSLPHVSATCWAWHAPGRYGSFIGQSPRYADGLAEAVAKHLAGCAHLKLVQSGINSLDEFGRRSAPQFTAEQLRAAVSTAVSQGLPVMVHANGEGPVELALAAGCSSIEHGYFMGGDNLERMADQRTWWVPTVVPMAALAEDRNLDAGRRAVAARTRDHQLDQIARATRAGVCIALGTDAGSPGVLHGEAVRQELFWLTAAGMPIEQAVRCASLNAAELMRLPHRGALLPGWRADLIAVPGTPRELPGSLASITGICFKGRWFQPGSGDGSS